MRNPRPVIILGPTAGGKSELAVAIAEACAAIDGRAGEVLGADSMQIYRHLDAGTAKPPPDLRQRVVHHLIDMVEPTTRFTVADWLQAAESLMEQLQQQGGRPIIVGGTNLYLKALLEGMFEAPGHDESFRRSLRDEMTSALHERLQNIDPPAAERIHPNDRKRIIRALEVHHLTGEPISRMQTQWAPAIHEEADGHGGYRHQPILIGLHWPTQVINPRINLRVKAMFYPHTVSPELAASICIGGESLPQEVRRLEQQGILGPADTQARQALGYKQVLQHLAGDCSLEQACEQTRIQTRRFAKQQRTWLKRFRGVTWLNMAQMTGQEAARQAANIVKQASIAFRDA